MLKPDNWEEVSQKVQSLLERKDDFLAVFQGTEGEKLVANHFENLEALARKLARGDYFYLVNMGLVKAGKSEFFNALLEKEGKFKTGVVRTTTTLQAEPWHLESHKIMLVDTPGIDAAQGQQDEEEAIAGYRQADLLIFLHNLKNGEFDAKEIEYLQKLREILAEEDHIEVIFVFTKSDELEEEDREKVVNKCLSQIKEHLGLENIIWFAVSSVLYLKALKADKPIKKKVFLKESGFIPFKAWLKEYLDAKVAQVFQQRLEQMKKILSSLRELLVQEKAKTEAFFADLKRLEKEKLEKIESFFQDLESAFQAELGLKRTFFTAGDSFVSAVLGGTGLLGATRLGFPGKKDFFTKKKGEKR